MKSPSQETGLMVKRLQMRHHRAMNSALEGLGVTIVQWDALRHLYRNPDASLHDLAVLTFQTDQAMGTLATRLQTRGLIERVPGPGRAVRHRLTSAGERVRAAGATIMAGVLDSSFAPLTPAQRKTFDTLLAKLLADDR